MTTGPASIHPRFSIQRHLGAGAFGEVYQVYDQERQMVVALKALREVNPETIYRFKQEFRSLADVTHRNLVTLYELMSDGERWFFTMELVDGVNFLDYARGSTAAQLVDSMAQSPGLDPAALPTLLAKRVTPLDAANDSTLQSAPQSLPGLSPRVTSTALAPPASMDMDRLLTSLGQLAEGLGALHEADKLHCDIKPSNVLVTPEKRVVLLDFGLVTELSDPNELMQTMAVVGTPAYMSPEQASGQPMAASDWYAVGVMLYQVLTGVLPFTGQLIEVLSNKQHLEPREAREIAADVPDDLNALCRDLLRRDPHARPSGVEVLRRLDQARNQATVHRVSLRAAQRVAPLVGRESHLAELSKAYLATKQGRTAVVLVTGNSGMGKSALVRRFLTDLPQRDSEVVVLAGRCYESESVPYKGLDMLVDALSRYLKGLPPNEAEALLPREVMALARLFPVLRQVDAVKQARRRVLEIPDSQEVRRRAFAALRELLARLAAQRPLVLFIDDLQWGDVDSGMLLAEILRPPDAPALLLIASYRDADAASSPFLRTFLPSLSATLETHRLVVGELSAADAQQLARALLAETRRLSATQLEAITREARGSPFFVHELTRYSGGSQPELATEPVAETGNAPATLDAVIWARVARLPERTRRLLEVVAVSGRPLPLAVARKATRLNGEEQQALTALRAGRLLRTRGTPDNIELETYHDRIRETVVAHLVAADLSRHHQQLAQLLEAAGNADPETLTVHFAGAGDVVRAAGYAAAAASQAAEALAFERAARLYQRALDLQPAPDEHTRLLRTRLADALTNAGRGAEAAHAYLAAIPGASAAESLDLQRRAAEQLLRSGHIDEGLAVIRTVLPAVGMKFPRTPQRALLSLIVHRLFASRRLEFHERAEAEVPSEELSRIDTCWSAAVGLVMVDAIRAADFQSRNLRFSMAAGEPVRIVRALSLEAAYFSATGNRGRGRTAKLLARASAVAERVKHPDALGSAALAAGTAAWFHGEYQRCFDLMQRAETIYREQCLGVSWELCTAQHFSLRAQIFLGELPAMLRRLPRLLQEAQDRGDLYAVTNFRTRIEYWTHLCHDAPTRAREELSQAIRRWSNQAFHSQHFYELVGQVEIALYAGDPLAAWQHLEPRWPAMAGSLILRNEPTRLEAWHVRARALLAAAAGSDTQRAAPLLEQAAADARRIARAHAGWSDPLGQLIEAGIAVSRGKTEQALTLLEQAERSFGHFGMRLFEVVTRRRRGELLGGEAGSDLVQAADRWIAERQVVRPDRIADMLAPGAWRGVRR